MTDLEKRLYDVLAQPHRIEEMQRALPDVSRRALEQALSALMDEGLVLKNKKNRYAQAVHYGYLHGTFLAGNHRYSFFRPDIPLPGGMGDLYIAPGDDGNAWNGDRVMVQLLQGGKNGRPTCQVVRVLQRSEGEVIGVLQKRGTDFVVESVSGHLPTILIPSEFATYAGDRQAMGIPAHEGERVSVQITDYGHAKRMARGKITAVLGEEGTIDASIASILRENGVFDSFPDEVQREAGRLPEVVAPEAAAGRFDYREKLVFTIDGDSAKDFDDAVSLENMDNGHFLLGVHIADVSHYVTEGSALDREAFRRGTSVYYPAHVVPMLPFALSHGICSLNPDVDRLTFSAFLEYDRDGRLHGARFGKTIIRSKARMTYNKVNAILRGDAALCREYSFLTENVQKMNALAGVLSRRRFERGALNMDLSEIEVECDERGEPVALSRRARGDAERLIEEFMLAANEAVATYMEKRGQPTVYRVHDKPDPQRLRTFAQFARPFGYRVDPGKPDDTAQLQAVLNGAKGDPAQKALPMLLLRALARARYDANCTGHFGLMARFYLHFTSPIRRYPDLIAHRMLQRSLSGEDFGTAQLTTCTEAAEQSTLREMAADTCERDITALYVAKYMHQFIGEQFVGEVSSITAFGIFVTLENGAEGLVRLEALIGDFYQFDDTTLTMVGRRTGKRFSIGDKMRVQLLSASESTGQIDFAPILE